MRCICTGLSPPLHLLFAHGQSITTGREHAVSSQPSFLLYFPFLLVNDNHHDQQYL